MKRIACFLVLLVLIIWACGNGNAGAGTLRLNRFEEEILEFERENQNKGVQLGAILFMGGDPIKQWRTLGTDFQGMPVKNRGFGGATLQEINHYYFRLTDPFQPELMVLYAGENDILMGASPEQVVQTFEAFQKQIAISHRTTRTIYIGIMPSPAHWDRWPEFQQVNTAIQERAAEYPSLEFLDISREMLDADGKPVAQLFEADGHTLNQAGYARWINALVPVLERMF